VGREEKCPQSSESFNPERGGSNCVKSYSPKRLVSVFKKKIKKNKYKKKKKKKKKKEKTNKHTYKLMNE